MPDPATTPVIMVDSLEELKLRCPGLPDNPHRNTDFEVVKKYPNELVATFKKNGGEIIRDTTGEPIHASNSHKLESLVAASHPDLTREDFTYISGPRK